MNITLNIIFILTFYFCYHRYD